MELEVPDFDKSTGKRLSTPYIQKFTIQEFKRMEEAQGFAHYKVTFKHDPTKGEALKSVKPHHIASDPSYPASIVNTRTDGSQTITATTKPTELGVLEPIEPVIKDWKNGNKTELQEKYKEVFNQVADDKLTKKELFEEIEERLEFLKLEQTTAPYNSETDSDIDTIGGDLNFEDQ